MNGITTYNGIMTIILNTRMWVGRLFSFLWSKQANKQVVHLMESKNQREVRGRLKINRGGRGVSQWPPHSPDEMRKHNYFHFMLINFEVVVFIQFQPAQQQLELYHHQDI